MPHPSRVRFTAGHDDRRSDRGVEWNEPVLRAPAPTGLERMRLFAWEDVTTGVDGR